ncbi:MAG: SDR family oxidoreductase [Polyangiaceae bacterium]
MADSKQGWALVTGASAGLGVEFARQLAKRGHDIVLVARRRQRLEELATELETTFKVKTLVLESDLGVAGASVALLEELTKHAILPEILVNNAGVGLYGPALELTLEKAASMIHLNVTSLTELSLGLGAKMAARGHGAIVNVASTASFQPIPFFGAYAATKAYVESFSGALTYELAPHGVRVLCHCPGPTRTEFNEAGGVKIEGGDFFYMSAEECVRIALHALDRGKRLVVTGFLNAISAWFGRTMPRAIVIFVAAKVMKPPSAPKLSA